MSLLRVARIGALAIAFAQGVFGASPSLPSDQAQVLQIAREYALGYAEKLPDFICLQITSRDNFSQKLTPSVQSQGRSPVPLPLSESSGKGDRIVERLTYFNGTEKYEVISIDGNPAPPGTDHLKLVGAISAGEFGTALRDIFDSRSGTEFNWHGIRRIRGHRAYAYEFRVPKEAGIELRDVSRGADVEVGYKGLVFVDAETRQVVRMTSTLDLPSGLSITAAERSVDYEWVTIADKKYTLPVRSEVMLQNDDSRYVNRIEFKGYRKFGTESTIHY